MSDNNISRKLLAELRGRWESEDRHALRTHVISALRKRQPLNTIRGLDKYEDKWDLRGLSFEPAKSTGDSVEVRGIQFDLISGVTHFKRLSLVDVDFTGSDLADVMWDRCRFADVVFDYANGTETGFWGCEFERVRFRKANLRGCRLGVNYGSVPCSYIDCQFEGADLRNTSQTITLYKNVLFQDVNLTGLNFDGARFESCTFIGKLRDVRFRKTSRMAMTGILFLRHLNTSKIPNQMVNVDFSRAQLNDVKFDGVDLSTCTFPDDGRHFVIHNQNAVFKKVYDKVARDWEPGPVRDDVLLILDALHLRLEDGTGMYLTPEKLAQPIDVINLDDYIDSFGPVVGPKVYDLLRETALTGS